MVLRKQLIKALDFTDKIVLLGRDVKEYVLQTYGKELERKIVIIPNWAVVSSTAAIAEEMKDVFQKKFTIVYSGNFGEASDFDTLLGSAKLLESEQDIRFVLIGNGRNKPAVRSKVKSLGLENIFFKDFLPDTTYRYVLDKASAFVVAMNKGSKGTSVPSKFYTYLSAGKPVIGIVPEGSEVALAIEEKSLGFVCSDYRAATLASQITVLKNDESLYRQMSINTGNVFTSEYSREKIISSYYEIVKELIK